MLLRAPRAFRDATLRMYMMTLNFYFAAPMTFSRNALPASETVSLMLQGVRAVWLNEPKASATSEGFPVRGIPHQRVFSCFKSQFKMG